MVEFIITVAGAILLAQIEAKSCAGAQASAAKVERLIEDTDKLKKSM